MNRLGKYGIAAAALGAASLTTLSSAFAQQSTTVVVPAQQPPPVTVQQPVVQPVAVVPARDVIAEEQTVPNTGLIVSGALMLGLTYTTSVVVAASSDNEADRHLYVPVVGPWLDLTDRDGCGEGRSCDAETANKVLLVFDGIFQGVGAAQIVGGFVFPSKRVVQRTASVTVTPRVGPSHYGVAAYGTF